jgi:hypothetical protein
MLTFDLDNLDTQRIGRMGELVVELELLARGWMVGNFNATTANSAGWDLFATYGRRSVRIRVKAKRPDVAAFRWSAKADGTIFLNLDSQSDDDFVAAVSFEKSGLPSVYVMPTQVVANTLANNHAEWLAGARRGGGTRKDTSMRNLHLDHRADRGPGHGFGSRWATYRDAWHLLAGVQEPTSLTCAETSVA